MSINFEEFDDQDEANEDALEGIVRLAREQYELEREIERATNDLKELKAKHLQVSRELLPDAMEAVGMKDFSLDNGYTVGVSDEVSAALPVKDLTKRGQALNWLADNGGEDIIKHEIKLLYGRGEHEQAAAMASMLDEKEAEYSETETVHAGTLKAWIKAELEDNTDIPRELFQVYEYREAKIKPPKKPRKPRK